MSELNEKIRQQLMEWAEPDFGTFSAGLIPGEKHVLGVRLPLLRSYAKELAKGDWQTYLLQAFHGRDHVAGHDLRLCEK